MKKTFLFLLFLSLFLPTLPTVAQVVTFQPSFATQNDSLIIVFDATQGNGDLKDFTGDVYLHTGVITTNSTHDTDWRYVPNGWDEYPAKVKATPLGDNKWEFKYLPNIREFFGITDPNEQVLKVAMLFRGTVDGVGDPDKVGRGDGGTDIFVELATNEATARFVHPLDDIVFLTTNDSIQIVGIGAVSSGDMTLELLKNTTTVATTTQDTLFYTFKASSTKEDATFKLVASGGGAVSDTASFFVTVRENNGAMVARPAGTRDGITYLSDTSVRLSLYAPYKTFVYVIGDFNDWKPGADYLMNKEFKTSDSVWYWIDIEGLTPGEEYGMQYLVDGEIRIADPYSELVLDEYNDPYIPESVFPDLKAYPSGKTSNYVSVLSPGKEPYEWEVTDFNKPDEEELVIYELLLRDFLEDHSYTSLIDTLDYLAGLNINAIELMPINEFEGNESWGYNPAFHLALDKYYGTPEAFKRFVDEAHKRGIAVIVDVVLNHAFGQNPLVRLWNEGDFGTPTSNNPYFNTSATHPFNVGYDFNHESQVTRYYSKRVMEYWLEEYNIDGYRFDLSKGFTQTNNPNNVEAWGAYDQSRIDIWNDYAEFIRSVEEDAYIILEHFADNAEEKVLTANGMMVWGNMNYAYNEATMGYHDGNKSDFSAVLAEERGFAARRLVGYMESHDEQWLMFKNRSFGNSSGSYNIKELGTALDRMELAGAFFLPLPGPKMIWQFGELGYGYGDAGEQCLNDSPDCPESAPGRTANKPIRWDYYSDPDRRDLYHTWSKLLHLRHSSPAFTDPEEITYNFAGSIKKYQLSHTDTDVVAVGNFGVTSATYTLDFTQDGTWYDYFGETTISVSDLEYELTLAPGEFKIFTTRKFDLPVAIQEEAADDRLTFTLYQNYPNPFNPSTTITYDVAKAGMVTLEIFNLIGQKVAVLVNEPQAAGTYTVRFDASMLSSGVYLARYAANGVVQTKKMLLLK